MHGTSTPSTSPALHVNKGMSLWEGNRGQERAAVAYDWGGSGDMIHGARRDWAAGSAVQMDKRTRRSTPAARLLLTPLK